MSPLWVLSLYFIVAKSLYWNESTPLPYPMMGIAVANNESSCLYIFGLPTPYNGTAQDNITVYQFDGNNYTAVGKTIAAPVYPDSSYTTIENEIYILNSGSEMIYIYNAATLEDNIPLRAQIGNEFMPLCLTSSDTQLFLLGTVLIDTFDGMVSLWIYDIISKSWEFSNSTWESIPKSVGNSCMYYKDVVYLFGCFYFGSNECVPDQDPTMILSYTRRNSRGWCIETELTIAIAFPYVIMPYNDGMMYVTGNGVNGPEPNSFELYNANNNEIMAIGTIQKATQYFMMGFINGHIHIMGGRYPPSNVFTADTEISDAIPTMNPSKAPTKSTKTPTNSPSKLPTSSTRKPTKKPTHHIVSVQISEQTLIYVVCGSCGLLFCCCIGIRCYNRKKRLRELYQKEGQRHASVGGVEGHDIVDTSKDQ
eukprot:535198_1